MSNTAATWKAGAARKAGRAEAGGVGLFDSMFRGATNPPGEGLSRAESFAGVLICAVAADGHISDEEANGLVNTLRRMRMYENIHADRVVAILNRLTGTLRRRGLDHLLEQSIAGLPYELRETAFAVCCDLAMADGGVERDEKVFLENLQKRLGISGDLALSIVEVMLIKNKG